MWAVAGGLWGSRAGLRGLLRCRDAALLPGCARGVHGSAVFCKNWLKKFASKTKKKFWYEGPSLGSHLTHKPSKMEFLVKTTSKKTRKEDHVRVRALNGLLYKALTDLLCTPEVSQELYDLNVELSKSDLCGVGCQVSLTPDFSACRVYWKTTPSAEQNAHMEAVLQRSAASMRHLLMSQQTVRNVPPIVFVKDKKSAALAELDKLLAVADFGPREERDDFVQNDFRMVHLDCAGQMLLMLENAETTAHLPSLLSPVTSDRRWEGSQGRRCPAILWHRRAGHELQRVWYQS
nr:putative ribosome-binding factor A, mitochondrial isoform X5 [Chlorocebus sabaeus]